MQGCLETKYKVFPGETKALTMHAHGGNVEVAGESFVPLSTVAVVVYGWDWMQKTSPQK
jgi:hypothetical protein